MDDTIATRMAADKTKLQQHKHGGLDDFHTELNQNTIHEAARENDLEALQRIVEQHGVDQIHALDEYGLTPLHWAADRGHATSVEYLIAMGADVNQVEARLFRRVPLHFAATTLSLAVVAVLLDHGADVNAVEYRGWNAVHFASHAGAVDILRELAQRGAINSELRTKAGESALHVAARNGQSECVRYLLVLSGDGIDSSLHQTALNLAKAAGHMEVVLVLEQAATTATAVAAVTRKLNPSEKMITDTRGEALPSLRSASRRGILADAPAR